MLQNVSAATAAATAHVSGKWPKTQNTKKKYSLYVKNEREPLEEGGQQCSGHF